MHRGLTGLAGYYLVSTVLTVVAVIARSDANPANPTTFRLFPKEMLNADLLEMLRNGGFDTRQPARIFLPPKFYSSVLFDSGHRAPEDVLGTRLRLMMKAVYDGPQQQQHQFSHRPNSIPYSDGGGAGNRNKGSGALEKNAVTNFKSSLPAAASSLAPSTTSPSFSSIAGADRSRSGGTTSQIVAGGPSRSSNQHHHQGASYNLRSALPGEPDVDYPILGRIPQTSFKCHGRHDGYYADVEARCQVFRVCANTDESGSGFAFLCPNGTLFNQKYFVCDWYTNVRCEESERYYSQNDQLGKNTADLGHMMMAVMSMVSFPMMSSMASGANTGGSSTWKSDLLDVMRGKVISADGGNGGSAGKPLGQQHDFVTRVGLVGGQHNSGDFSVQPNAGISRDRVQAHTGGGVKQEIPRAPLGIQNQRQQQQQQPQVYVSNLGTLSIDPQSGFDPVKSAILGAPQIGRDLLPPPVGTRIENNVGNTSPRYPLQRQQQYVPEKPQSSPGVEVELIMAKLLKTWTDSGYAQMPSQQPVRPQPVPQTILPPSGVLPPSFTDSRRRLLSNAVSTSQITQSFPAPHNPNPATVQNVFRVDKAFVTPQQQQQAVAYPSANYYYNNQAASTVGARFGTSPSWSSNVPQQQVTRRSDVPVRLVVPRQQHSVREVGYDFQVLPAVSYHFGSQNWHRRAPYQTVLQKRWVAPTSVHREGYGTGFAPYYAGVSGPRQYYVLNH